MSRDMSISQAPVNISVVVIGRNEGLRLVRCLQSVHAAHWGNLSRELLYVDSHSTDDSCVEARRLGARVLSLVAAAPCAAAGRNAGWRAAVGEWVMFLDGDTVLEPDFIAHAVKALQDRSVVAVWGHRRELAPEQSILTRVLDLDWVFATGRVDYFGGDVLVRRAALAECGGFDDTLVAGEEPELSRRLRERGWCIEHIDVPMTGHDLAITTTRAWWRRAERAGLAYAQVSARFAGTPDPLWRAESRRNIRHGVALLLAPPALAAAAWASPWMAASLLALAVALLARSARRARWKAPGQDALAWAYALHSHLQQLPILLGQLRWRWLRLKGVRPSLIEYKAGVSRSSVAGR